MGAPSRIPTVNQVFGALNGLWKAVEQETDLPFEETVSAFAMRLGHEPRGRLTGVRLGPKGAEAYEELQSRLLAATHWGRRGSLDLLRKLAQRFVLEMKVDPGPGRRAIQRKFRQHFEDQLGGPMRRFRIVAHVPARLLQPYEVQLGNLTFRCMTDEQKGQLAVQLRRALKRRRSAPGDPIEGFEHLRGRDVVCITDVKAPDLETASIVAQELIDDGLDAIAGILALLRDAGARDNDPRRWAGPRIAIELGAAKAKAYLGGLNPHEVDLTDLAQWRTDPNVRRLLRLAMANAPRDEQRSRHDGPFRLQQAIQWLGRSRRARTEIAAYVYACIAFETLLQSDKKLGIGYSLRLRCAQLLEKNRSARRRVFERIDDLYERRSTIMHGNRHNVGIDELIAFWSLLNNVIRAFIERGFHKKRHAEIERWFEDQCL